MVILSVLNLKFSVGAIWCLDDMLVMLRRCFAATIDDWNSRLSCVETNQSKKKDDKRKSLESRSSQNALNDFIEGVSLRIFVNCILIDIIQFVYHF